MFPKYFFAAIPAMDVRTKKPQPAKEEVLGLLDSDKKIHPQYLEETKELFQKLNSYFHA